MFVRYFDPIQNFVFYKNKQYLGWPNPYFGYIKITATCCVAISGTYGNIFALMCTTCRFKNLTASDWVMHNAQPLNTQTLSNVSSRVESLYDIWCLIRKKVHHLFTCCCSVSCYKTLTILVIVWMFRGHTEYTSVPATVLQCVADKLVVRHTMDCHSTDIPRK